MSRSQEDLLREKYASLSGIFKEAERRLWAAAEARSLGRGGIAITSRATGLSRDTIRAGLHQLDDPSEQTLLTSGRTRRAGGGRPSAAVAQPGLEAALDQLVNPVTRGDPMSALRWSSKSTTKLASELKKRGFRVTASTVGKMLKAQDYSLQAARKTQEGGDHPDRDAQFRFIQRRVQAMQEANQPVLSVDCKKKELVGDFKNGGREYQSKDNLCP